jgi:hypothetical protein
MWFKYMSQVWADTKRHDVALGSAWATVFTLWSSTIRPESFLSLFGSRPFDPKHDGHRLDRLDLIPSTKFECIDVQWCLSF